MLFPLWELCNVLPSYFLCMIILKVDFCHRLPKASQSQRGSEDTKEANERRGSLSNLQKHQRHRRSTPRTGVLLLAHAFQKAHASKLHALLYIHVHVHIHVYVYISLLCAHTCVFMCITKVGCRKLGARLENPRTKVGRNPPGRPVGAQSGDQCRGCSEFVRGNGGRRVEQHRSSHGYGPSLP